MRSNWNNAANPYALTVPNMVAPVANMTGVPPDSLSARQARLIGLLRQVLPHNIDTSFLNARYLETINFQRDGPDSAKIVPDELYSADDRSWEINNADPALLTEIETAFTAYSAAVQQQHQVAQSEPPSRAAGLYDSAHASSWNALSCRQAFKFTFALPTTSG